MKPTERNVTKQAERNAILDERVGNALAMLDALNFLPLTDEDIDTEITAAHQERTERRSI